MTTPPPHGLTALGAMDLTKRYELSNSSNIYDHPMTTVGEPPPSVSRTHRSMVPIIARLRMYFYPEMYRHQALFDEDIANVEE